MNWIGFFVGMFLGAVLTILLVGLALYWKSMGVAAELDKTLPQVRPPRIPRN